MPQPGQEHWTGGAAAAASPLLPACGRSLRASWLRRTGARQRSTPRPVAEGGFAGRSWLGLWAGDGCSRQRVSITDAAAQQGHASRAAQPPPRAPMHIWQGRKPLPVHCVHGVAAAVCRLKGREAAVCESSSSEKQGHQRTAPQGVLQPAEQPRSPAVHARRAWPRTAPLR